MHPKTQKATYRCIRQVKDSLAEFISATYGVSDMAFGQMTHQFISDYEHFLIDEQGKKAATAHKHFTYLKQACHRAYKDGLTDKHLFARYKEPTIPQKAPRTITPENFQRIVSLEIPSDKSSLIISRDLLLIACYTGMAYVDTVSVTQNNLSYDEQGNLWLKYNRKKTMVSTNRPGVQAVVKLIFLRQRKHLCPATANDCLAWLSRLVFLAVDKEILRSNPLENIEYEKVKRNVEIRYLTREQVKMLLAHPFQQRQMELARHMLLFTVFTGLAYVDLTRLRPEHIQTDVKGRRFIRKCRQKTDVETFVPLHPIAEQILALYNTTDNSNPVFPLPPYANYRLYKEFVAIGIFLGLDRNLSHHA